MESMKQWHEAVESRDAYWIQKAKTFVSLDLERLFVRRGLSKAEWAQRIGKSKAYISKIFNHDANFTVETLVKLARSLDGRVEIRVVPAESQSQLVPQWGERSIWVGTSFANDGDRSVITPSNVPSVLPSNDTAYAHAA